MSAQNDSLAEVHFHSTAISESRSLGYDPAYLGKTLRRAWGSLRATRGSKIRALSGTSDREYRLRVDGVRAVFSIVCDSSGRVLAYVHLVAPRNEVYRNDAFGARVSHFYQSSWDRDSRTSVAGNKYVLVGPDTSASVPIEVDLEFNLYDQQQRFFDKVLPFKDPAGVGEPLLVIGYGPPGSGKTIVGCQLLTAAWRSGHDVDVLVPSPRLRDDYRAHVASLAAVQEMEANSTISSVRVLQFDEYFAHCASLSIPPSRFSQFHEWWSKMLGDVRAGSIADNLRRRVQKGKLTKRELTYVLPSVLDALVDDAQWQRTAALPADRDFLSEDLARILDTVRETADAIREEMVRSNLDVPTRGELAIAAMQVAPVRSGTRLILVDEAQDMAPAEWRALLAISFGAPKSATADWRLVLLGDTRQRVSLVPFDWKDVKRVAYEEHRIPPQRIVEGQVDVASYRMGRSIAAAAQSVFAPEVVTVRGARQQGRLELDQLEDRGTVTVLVVDLNRSEIADALRCCQDDALEQENLIVVYQTTADDTSLRNIPETFCEPVREVKGLEYDSVVVLARDMRSRVVETLRLSGEDSTELYTAISRARENVLLIVGAQLWSILRRAEAGWANAFVLEGSSAVEQFELMLLRHRVNLSDAQLTEALMARLDRLCDGRSEVPEDWIARLLETSRRLSERKIADELDTATELARMGVTLLQQWREGYERVRSEAARAINEGDDSLACTLLVLLGETALAADHAMRTVRLGRRISWTSDALEVCRDESQIQMARAASGISWNNSPWTAETAARELVSRVTTRINAVLQSSRSQ